MLMPMLLGCTTVFISMGIQVLVVVLMIRFVFNIMNRKDRDTHSITFDTMVIGVVLLILFVGHMLQIAIWAELFIVLNEFDDFLSAFYHSAVNFASLGYGDIVMSERWRLLGAIEASNGVLMFGLSAGTLLSVMSALFAHHRQTIPTIKGKTKTT
jgi:hypothetical protein